MSIAGIALAENNTLNGFYLGVDAGVIFNDAQLISQQLGFVNPNEICDTSAIFSTFSPGIHLGYAHSLTHSFVAGIESNTTFNINQKYPLDCNCVFNPEVDDSFTLKNQLQTSIKGRIGRSVYWHKNSFLPYFTAGVSIANFSLSYQNEGGNYYNASTIKLGWLIGAGVEWVFKQHWSLRTEYDFTHYGNAINLSLPTIYDLFDPNGNAKINLEAHDIVASINYWI